MAELTAAQASIVSAANADFKAGKINWRELIVKLLPIILDLIDDLLNKDDPTPTPGPVAD